MEFDKHVFISYAHIDNQPLTSKEKGWISRFHDSLRSVLSTRLGLRPRFGGTKASWERCLSREIVGQFPQTALLVSVLTPRYVDSDWCTREVREFCRIAQQFGGLVVNNKSRVFKVIKMPVDIEGPYPR